jgi:hypothetical protein
MQAQQPAVRHAQAAHHGAGIEMALHVAAAGHGHRHRGKDHGQHRRQTKKALGPIQRRTRSSGRALPTSSSRSPRANRLAQPLPEGGNRPVVRRRPAAGS